jgi:nitroreductase
MIDQIAGVNAHPPAKKARWGVGPKFPVFGRKDIGDDALARLIAVAHQESAEWSLQSWRWIAVRGEAAKKYLEAATYVHAALGSAPAVLIALADTLAWKSAPQYLQGLVASREITEEEGREALRRLRDYYTSSPEVAHRTALASAFMAVHHVLQGAPHFGLAAHGVTEFDESKIKTHFHIPDHFLVAALILLGYPDDAPAPPPAPLTVRTLIYKEKFGELLHPDGKE